MNIEKLHQEFSRDEAYRRAYAEEDLIHRIAERVLRYRELRDLSQEALAELVGTQQPGIAAVEGGFVNLTLRRLARFAYALRCRPVDLVVRATPLALQAAAEGSCPVEPTDYLSKIVWLTPEERVETREADISSFEKVA